MSLSEVFRPSTGGLLVRDNISEGKPISASMFIRDRPATQGSSRFGQLSRSQFFTRHNPHPSRVRHFKGLLDVPICSVNDEGQFATPNYSLNFPPNSYNLSKLGQWKGRIPVNSLNVDSNRHQINAVTGLDYFTGLNSYPFKEKAVPRVGLVPVNASWREQLKSFTDQLGAEDGITQNKKEERPRTTMYSQDTGRLIPPPSRAMSRQASRRAQRTPFGGPLQHIAADPDVENMVLTMLCQILQTEDTNAVQQWLCSAADREKSVVMDLIRAAMVGKDEYNRNTVPINILGDDSKNTFLPPIGETNSSTADRLVVNADVINNKLDNIEEEYNKISEKPILTDTDQYTMVQPPSTEVFRPATQGQNLSGPIDTQPASWNPYQSMNTF